MLFCTSYMCSIVINYCHISETYWARVLELKKQKLRIYRGLRYNMTIKFKDITYYWIWMSDKHRYSFVQKFNSVSKMNLQIWTSICVAPLQIIMYNDITTQIKLGMT